MVFTNNLFDRAAKGFLLEKNNVVDELLFGIEDLKYVYQESLKKAVDNELLEQISIMSESWQNEKAKKEVLAVQRKLDDCVTF